MFKANFNPVIKIETQEQKLLGLIIQQKNYSNQEQNSQRILKNGFWRILLNFQKSRNEIFFLLNDLSLYEQMSMKIR
ncbi:unnamed protein product [Paramecium sonneborni]|uniref:Uncharacterized protein n=1 Tax=Paramecium sonneborni TaxID=65129 RepID=A0A8S1PY62_9CILI|nr:unnamed protein product [Paramecium sonneborni]